MWISDQKNFKLFHNMPSIQIQSLVQIIGWKVLTNSKMSNIRPNDQRRYFFTKKFTKTQIGPIRVNFENSAVYKPIRPLLFLFCQKSVMNEFRKHIHRKLFYSPEVHKDVHVMISKQLVFYLMVLYLNHLDYVFYNALCHRFHHHQLFTVSLVLEKRNLS